MSLPVGEAASAWRPLCQSVKLDQFDPPFWGVNSAVECHLHTVEVIGSNPIAPTILMFLGYSRLRPADVVGNRFFDPMPDPMAHCMRSVRDFAADHSAMEVRCGFNAS